MVARFDSMPMTKNANLSKPIASLFRALSQPARVEILLAIGNMEACVCHLESILGMRQAYISQNLMGLREAGILTARRDGKYIFYRVQDQQVVDLITTAATLAGIPARDVLHAATARPHLGCCCPQCTVVSPRTYSQG